VRLVFGMIRARRYHCGRVIGGQLRVAGVQVRIVQMTLEHALLQAVRHRHMRYATVVGVHAPMAAKPVAALHVLGGPGEQQLTEAKAGDKDPCLSDLAGSDVDPLDRIAGVIHFHALAGFELARRNGGFAVLRELAIELLYMDAPVLARPSQHFCGRRSRLQFYIRPVLQASACGPDGDSLIRLLISRVSFMPMQFFRLGGSRSDLFSIMS
jgi:hypothetical protein